MYLSEDFRVRWEHIVSDIDITEAPVECIKKIIFKKKDRKQKTINVSTLRKQGLDNEEIENVLNRLLIELGDEVENIEFVLDIEEIAKIVQPHTDSILKSL